MQLGQLNFLHTALDIFRYSLHKTRRLKRLLDRSRLAACLCSSAQPWGAITVFEQKNTVAATPVLKSVAKLGYTYILSRTFVGEIAAAAKRSGRRFSVCSMLRR
jgi:hypothetical protein